MVFGVADEVPDDQEISGELHLLDDSKLALQALLIVGDGMLQLSLLLHRTQGFQAAGEAFAGYVDEVAVNRVAGWDLELRKRIRNFFQAEAAALGDIERAREYLGGVLEQARHFVVVLDEELRTVELHAARVVNGLAGLDAQHDVLGVGIVFAQVMAVIGGHERQAEIFLELEEAGMDAVLHLQSLILNLEKEVLFAENIGECSGGRAGGVVIALGQAFRDFSFEASGEADQAAGMFGEKLLAHARFVIEAVQRGLGRDLYEIAVAFVIFGKHEQMVVGIAFGRRAVVIFFADVEFAADDGFHARLLSRVDKMDCAKDIAVVGHGHGRHAQLFHALAKLFDITGAVEQGVVRVQVQVDELGHGFGRTSLPQPGQRKTGQFEGAKANWRRHSRPELFAEGDGPAR